jgi:hypothetical protein
MNSSYRGMLITYNVYGREALLASARAATCQRHAIPKDLPPKITTYDSSICGFTRASMCTVANKSSERPARLPPSSMPEREERRKMPEREERRKKASTRQATMRAKRSFWFGAVVHPTDSSQGLENLNRIALVFLHVASMHPIL